MAECSRDEPPPPYCQVDPSANLMSIGPPVIEDYQQEKISQEQIRQLLINHVKGKHFYSQKPLNQMVFDDILMYNGYFYELNTLTETRIVSYGQRPYQRSTLVDGYNFGPPNVWDIEVPPPGKFEDYSTHLMTIPHTDEIRSCRKCKGTGVLVSAGTTANGTNVRTQRTCASCLKSTCVILYQQFRSVFQADKQQMMNGRPETIDANDFIKAGAIEVFNEMNERATPLARGQFVDEEIVEFSQRATTKVFANKAIKRQQQIICAIPVVEVIYTFNNTPGTFYLYGTKREVHFPKYPRSYCSIQ